MEKRNYWVEVETDCNEGMEYDWYKVTAVSEEEAEEKVIDWCKNNGYWFSGYTSIGNITENAPVLITEID